MSSGPGHCASGAGGWQDGKLPNDHGAEEKLKVCFSHHGEKCWKERYITVRNCGTFFLYLLSDVENCYYRYCVKPKNR